MQLTTLTQTDAKQLGADAFVFGYPLLLLTTTMRCAVDGGSDGSRGGLNRFAHLRRFPDPSARAIVAANADTLYSLTWLDLTSEPVLLELPDTGERSYLMPLLDAWTNVFTSLGPRTAGDTGITLAIVGPGWNGEIPNGAQRIDAPTNNAWGIFHLHAMGRKDLETSQAIQEQLVLAPLSDYESTGTTTPPAVIEEPVLDPLPQAHRRVMEMDVSQFLAELAAQMKLNPPAPVDLPMLKRMAAIELKPGEPFNWEVLSETTREGLAAGFEEGKEMVTTAPKSETEAGWQAPHTGAGSYGTDYLRRARTANFALGTNRPEDAIFPLTATDSDGHQLSGTHRYLLRFAPDALPPVDGIWSLAIYDMDQLLVSNPIDRYALGSRDEMESASDGSLEIAIQHDRPDGSEANWLPAPAGDFNLMLHIYWPSQCVFDGNWTIPPVLRIAE